MLVAVSAVDVVVAVLFSLVVIVVLEILVVLVVVNLAILSVELAIPSVLAITSELLTHHNIEQ